MKSSAGIYLRWDSRIRLRDGICLSANVYLPRGEADPAPCLFMLTPYTAARSHLRARYFAEQGYVFLVVDARGRGNSDGVFRPFIQEAEDGHDVVEWIARQPFCSGKVAMFSGSYEGYAQWVTASQLPPHLATIAPAVAAAPGIDMTLRNNISFPYLVQWLSCVAGRASQDPIFVDMQWWRRNFRHWYESGRPFRELDTIAGMPSAIFQEWLSHPIQDSYWDAFTPTASQFARLNLPILTVTGCYDANQLGALHYYREHLRHASPSAAAEHYLIIGPWDHVGALAPRADFGGIALGQAALLDVLHLHLQWYDWILRDGPKPEFLKKNVAYYVMGLEKWRYADTLDAVTAQSKPLYLDSCGGASRLSNAGTLGDAPGHGPEDRYTYDPCKFSKASVDEVDRIPQIPPLLLRPIFPAGDLREPSWLPEHEGHALIYQSRPFTREVELSGFFRASIWLAIDQPDTDFGVTVFECAVDGGSILLTSDVMRARYREGLRAEHLIRTTDPLLYEFNRFTFISRQIRAGSRLRLVIGPLNSEFYQRNHNSGKNVAEESIADARPVTVRLFHDRAHPSALYIPIAQPD